LIEQLKLITHVVNYIKFSAKTALLRG